MGKILKIRNKLLYKKDGTKRRFRKMFFNLVANIVIIGFFVGLSFFAYVLIDVLFR